jgi:hypothetical protein
MASMPSKISIAHSVGRNGVNGRSDVLTIQQLINANLPIPLRPIDVDGRCGTATITAIEEIQRRNLRMVRPDGKVDPNGATFRFLTGASQDAPAPESKNATAWHISQSGIEFIYAEEAYRGNKPGNSNHLYWPGGNSGVTLGAGYDMRERSAESIQQDMLAIGLDTDTAKKIAGGAGLTDTKAETFANDNFDLVDITVDQETQLLCDILPDYEAIVRSAINVDLTEYQFDALVSFAYNPGGRMTHVAHLINVGKITEAMDEIKKANTSKGKVMKGLTIRRAKEVKLFLEGDYG